MEESYIYGVIKLLINSIESANTDHEYIVINKEILIGIDVIKKSRWKTKYQVTVQQEHGQITIYSNSFYKLSKEIAEEIKVALINYDNGYTTCLDCGRLINIREKKYNYYSAYFCRKCFNDRLDKAEAYDKQFGIE